MWEFDPTVYGWTIKTTATEKVSVCKLLFHYRVAITSLAAPDWWQHGWCYSGYGSDDLMVATLAAVAWDPDTDGEPVGWFKRACSCIRGAV